MCILVFLLNTISQKFVLYNSAFVDEEMDRCRLLVVDAGKTPDIQEYPEAQVPGEQFVSLFSILAPSTKPEPLVQKTDWEHHETTRKVPAHIRLNNGSVRGFVGGEGRELKRRWGISQEICWQRSRDVFWESSYSQPLLVAGEASVSAIQRPASSPRGEGVQGRGAAPPGQGAGGGRRSRPPLRPPPPGAARGEYVRAVEAAPGIKASRPRRLVSHVRPRSAEMSPCVMLLVLLAATVAPLAARVGMPLLSYIKPCWRYDPQLNDCARRHGNEAIPHLAKGDPKYHIPVLDPLLVKEVKVEQGSGPIRINLKAIDMLIEGLKDTTIKDMRVDFANKSIVVKIAVPRMKLTSRYTIDGQVLVLPIRGDGDMTINLDEFSSTTNHEIQWVDKQGARFMRLLTPNIDYHIKSGNIHFTNLFNGDKALGDNMNAFLNENWSDVVGELGPTIGEVIRAILDSILQSAVESTPFDEMYPEEL
ncbi:circadian clock-controlled protein daywake-like [Bacillus rossius redtenbacheri]|uniref:circadian clock-controlled protein daywake-like n=1 Tax=Bacillus rossius redtenbacheri TaxID=93214 RepID=UPI002FDD51E3